MASKNVILTTVRCFSSNGINNQLVKPPIQVFGLDGRYASALYSAASKNKVLDTVEKELISLQNSVGANVLLKDFLLNPVIKRKVKGTVFKDVSGKLSFSAPTANFLGLLAENGRLRNLNSIINIYRSIMSVHRGDLPCEVTTARPLDAALNQELTGILQKFAKKGENIILTTKVNPDIIGGMIVSIGDKYVDLSIASKIKKYSDILKSTV